MPTGIPTKLKICKICGNEFLPKTPSQKICENTHISHCPICGKEVVWNSTRITPPCSRACSRELTKQRNIEKYGVPHPMQNDSVKQKFASTMIEKYGVEHALQNDEIKQRAIDTNQAKFGHEWALGSPQIHEKIKDTMTKKYGAPTTLESPILLNKVNSTIQNKYGVDHIARSEIVKNKIKETNIERYGYENPLQNKEIADKVKSTRIKRYGEYWSTEMQSKKEATLLSCYGVTNPSFCPEVIDKIANTMLRKYGVKSAILVPEFRQKMIDTMIERYGSEFYVTSNAYANLENLPISKTNLTFSDKLTKFGIQHSMEFTGISNKRYDFLLTDFNVLIEIDPTYTHNLIGNHFDPNGTPPDYHLNKTQLAIEHGYRCIHIFDWDNSDKIINSIQVNNRIYARNCEILKIGNDDCDEFLNKYHLQNTCRGQLIKLGLCYQNELIQIMTFGKPRYNGHYEWELLRLCTKPNYVVIGGSERLIKHFIRQYHPNSIISYCDRSKFIGNVYEHIGFNHIYDTPPTIHWSKRKRHISHNLLLQLGYDKLFKTNFGKDYSNEYLMLQDGWLPVCDCGMAVFEYKKGTSI